MNAWLGTWLFDCVVSKTMQPAPHLCMSPGTCCGRHCACPAPCPPPYPPAPLPPLDLLRLQGYDLTEEPDFWPPVVDTPQGRRIITTMET